MTHTCETKIYGERRAPWGVTTAEGNRKEEVKW